MEILPSSIEKIGIFREDAIGRIYEGTLADSERKVIVKELLLPASMEKTGKVRIRLNFLKEAESQKGIINSCLAIPISFGEENHTPYVVYHLPPGIPLYPWLRKKGALPPAEALMFFRRILKCYILLFKNNIHRYNVIPNDFFITENSTVQMVDTSLGTYDQSSGLSRAGLLTGDRAFYAPEQIKKGKVSERAMVFSLGCLFYWILTGRRLYSGNSPFEVMSDILTNPFTSLPGEINASMDLEDFVRRMLHRDENVRFASVGAVLDAIPDVIDRERIEESLRENRDKTEEVTITPVTTSRGYQKIILGVLLIILIVVVAPKFKQWFFSPHFDEPVVHPSGISLLRDAKEEIYNGNLKKARSLAMNVLNYEVHNSEAGLIVGQSYFGEENYEEAAEYFTRAMRFGDRSQKIYAGRALAETMIRLGNYNKAARQLNQAVRLTEDENTKNSLKNRRLEIIPICLWESRKVIRVAESNSDRIRKLREMLDVVEEIDPEHDAIVFLKGAIAHFKGDHDLAFELLGPWCEDNPDDDLARSLYQSSNENL